MGQVFSPSSGGIAVAPVDRESGPGADGGATGNRALFLGAGAGTNSPLSDNIVLGNAAENGSAASTAGNGTIVIGSQAVQATNVIYDRSSSDATAIGPAIVIGFNAAQSLNTLPNTLIIGNNAAKNFINTGLIQSIWNNTIIGDRALELPGKDDASTFFNENVIIGSRAARGSAGILLNHIHNTFIGANVFGGVGTAAGASVSDNVVIGYNAAGVAGTAGNPANCVVIGASACASWSGGVNCVAIGQNTEIGNGGSAFIHDNTVIGASAQCNGGQDNTIVGSHTGGGAFVPSGSDWNLFGYGAGAGSTATDNDVFIIETLHNTVRRAILYSNETESGGKGNIVLGNSAPGTSRQYGGGTPVNCLKLLNGTIGGTPVGGGYFYVTAGALHWVGSAGTDTAVAPA